TEYQWEKAARGPSGQIWPWGNLFNSDYIHNIESIIGYNIGSLEEYYANLNELDRKGKLITTSIGNNPKNISPYGVKGMVGNTWEFTASRYLDEQLVQPNFRGLEASVLWDDWSAWVTVKGGSFNSWRENMLPAFKEKRLIINRDLDVGFRCVYNLKGNTHA
ncbi:formylglycine-generating enzyme family protein, partial [Bacillus wiedmannii]